MVWHGWVRQRWYLTNEWFITSGWLSGMSQFLKVTDTYIWRFLAALNSFTMQTPFGNTSVWNTFLLFFCITIWTKQLWETVEYQETIVLFTIIMLKFWMKDQHIETLTTRFFNNPRSSSASMDDAFKALCDILGVTSEKNQDLKDCFGGWSKVELYA